MTQGNGVRFAGALALGALAAATAGPANARDAQGSANADARCAAQALRDRLDDARNACDSDSRNQAKAIDLAAPSLQLDFVELWQKGAMADVNVRWRGSRFLDLGSMFNFRDALSESDMLLLSATSIDAGSSDVEDETQEAQRVVAGLMDFGTGGGAGALRPEVASYLANQMAGLSMATQSVRALRDRLEAQPAEQPGFALWLRPVGQEDGLGGDANALLHSATDTTVVHAGVDYSRRALTSEVDGVHLGLMASYGKAVSHASVKGNLASAKSEVTAGRLGVYSTWYENEVERTGFYLDGWLGYTLLRNAVFGDNLPKEFYGSGAWAGSLEAGYGWEPFGDDLRIEPQLQLLYAGGAEIDHVEANGTLIGASAGGLSTRLGVRVDQEWRLAGSALVKPYAEMNWHHDFDSAEVSFDGVVVSATAPRDRFEFSVGLDAKFESNWSAALNVQAQRGANDYSGIEALVTVNYAW